MYLCGIGKICIGIYCIQRTGLSFLGIKIWGTNVASVFEVSQSGGENMYINDVHRGDGDEYCNKKTNHQQMGTVGYGY